MDINTSIGEFSEKEFIKRCNEKSFPDGLIIDGHLDLEYGADRTTLTSLPVGLEVRGCLDLRGCSSLTALPKGLQVRGYLNLHRCTSLISLPEGLIAGSSLNLTDCTSLTSLPEGLQVSGYLDLHGCISLTALPKGLEVGWTLYVEDPGFIEQYPFRDLPKILHLPFQERQKQIIMYRLKNGY